MIFAMKISMYLRFGFICWKRYYWPIVLTSNIFYCLCAQEQCNDEVLVCTDDVPALPQVSGLSDSDSSNDDLSCTLYKVGEIQSGSFLYLIYYNFVISKVLSLGRISNFPPLRRQGMVVGGNDVPQFRSIIEQLTLQEDIICGGCDVIYTQVPPPPQPTQIRNLRFALFSKKVWK